MQRFTYEFASFSEQGGRSANEDSMRILQDDTRVLALVADGLGGQGEGATASRLATETVGDRAYYLQWRWSPRRASSLFQHANAAIRQEQARQTSRMMTTLAALFLQGDEAILAHVGDSRIYWFRGGYLYHQTADHSVSQAAVQAGEIRADQLRFHADRNRLLRALGGAREADIDCYQDCAMPGDAFLLCTDGFWELIEEDEMQECLLAHPNATLWLDAMRTHVLGRMSAQADNATAVALLLK